MFFGLFPPAANKVTSVDIDETKTADSSLFVGGSLFQGGSKPRYKITFDNGDYYCIYFDAVNGGNYIDEARLHFFGNPNDYVLMINKEKYEYSDTQGGYVNIKRNVVRIEYPDSSSFFGKVYDSFSMSDLRVLSYKDFNLESGIWEDAQGNQTRLLSQWEKNKEEEKARAAAEEKEKAEFRARIENKWGKNWVKKYYDDGPCVGMPWGLVEDICETSNNLTRLIVDHGSDKYYEIDGLPLKNDGHAWVSNGVITSWRPKRFF